MMSYQDSVLWCMEATDWLAVALLDHASNVCNMAVSAVSKRCEITVHLTACNYHASGGTKCGASHVNGC